MGVPPMSITGVPPVQANERGVCCGHRRFGGMRLFYTQKEVSMESQKMESSSPEVADKLRTYVYLGSKRC